MRENKIAPRNSVQTNDDFTEKALTETNELETKISSNMQNFGNTIEQTTSLYNNFARIAESSDRRDVELAKIAKDSKQLDNELKKINVIEQTITTHFKERARNFDKFEEVIDKGLEINNLDYVIAGLQAMATVVTQSPLDTLKSKNKKAISSDNDSIAEL